MSVSFSQLPNSRELLRDFTWVQARSTLGRELHVPRKIFWLQLIENTVSYPIQTQWALFSNAGKLCGIKNTNNSIREWTSTLDSKQDQKAGSGLPAFRPSPHHNDAGARIICLQIKNFQITLVTSQFRKAGASSIKPSTATPPTRLAE